MIRPTILTTMHTTIAAMEDGASPFGPETRLIESKSQGLMPRDEVLARIGLADALMNCSELAIDDELLDAAGRLKIVVNLSAGYENLDLDLLARRGIWATNSPDQFTESTSEWAFGLLLAVTRKVLEADRYVRSGQWWLGDFKRGFCNSMCLADKTLGVIGKGRIGRAVARRAEAFGMKVIYNSPSAEGEASYRPLEELLAEADVVSLHVALNDKTRRLINADTLELMKPGAILVNTSRGKTVDEAALAAALHAGHLGGAGLDVFEDEPNIHPDLLTAPNVVLSPHMGAGTEKSIADCWRLAAENIALVMEGKAPNDPLNRPE